MLTKQKKGVNVIFPKIWEEPLKKSMFQKIPTKKYYASRGMFGVHVAVNDNDSRVYELRHIPYHSPGGFEWGYGGSGPADLARSILADCAGMKVADTFYQDFKRDFIACMPERGFVIKEEAIREWLEEKVKEAWSMK